MAVIEDIAGRNLNVAGRRVEPRPRESAMRAVPSSQSERRRPEGWAGRAAAGARPARIRCSAAQHSVRAALGPLHPMVRGTGRPGSRVRPDPWQEWPVSGGRKRRGSESG